MPAFYEFFAGGGMARAGLGPGWRCLFSNDIDRKKADAYIRNWGREELYVGDVARLSPAELPLGADLAWASFPCQDLSLAGSYAGLGGKRSGTFWPFWYLMLNLIEEQRAPRVIVLENVCGALSSHGGSDFAAIGQALSDGGYRFGALIMDAVRFVPQSRPRLFVVAVDRNSPIPEALLTDGPGEPWRPAQLNKAYETLPPSLKERWLWWNLAAPPPRTSVFSDLIEQDPSGVDWHDPITTRRLIGMMSPLHLEKVEAAKRAGRTMVGAIYKRTRRDEAGRRVQRAEVRFDGIAGCLRTPVGGSSRQSILVVRGEEVRSRLLSPREAARLMGLPETYHLPASYNEAYHLAGDGVVVPVVRHLASCLLEPLVDSIAKDSQQEAA